MTIDYCVFSYIFV